MSANALTIVDAGFSPDQIEIIKSQVAPDGTTRDELALFLQYCQRTGLDPFARQIYLSERRSQDRNGNWITTRKPETTIDGFRLLAERSGQYAGQLGPQWCDDDGVWRDVWTKRDVPPAAARVGVLRHDFTEPLWAVALYDEYVQVKRDGNPNSMWTKMPANQLAKCAESLALRRAFPRELSGLYTREEMPDPKTEGKEAQADYLASKGLEPYVAPKHLPPATKPELIRELSDELDKPSTKTIEMRSAAQIAEAEAILKDVKKPAAKHKKGSISFEALRKWKELKDELRQLTGTDTVYYSALKSKGYDHADEIKSEADATAIWKVLGSERNRLRERKDAADVLAAGSDVIGARAFADLLGVHGCLTIEDALGLASDPWQALLADLKGLVDERQEKVNG